MIDSEDCCEASEEGDTRPVIVRADVAEKVADEVIEPEITAVPEAELERGAFADTVELGALLIESTAEPERVNCCDEEATRDDENATDAESPHDAVASADAL